MGERAEGRSARRRYDIFLLSSRHGIGSPCVLVFFSGNEKEATPF